MNKESFKKALDLVKSNSPKRNFKQTYDLVINVKDLNLKKPEQQVDLFISLNHPRAKKAKVCALIGPELGEQAKANCDKFILYDDFPRYAGNKIELRKLAKGHKFFIAQANLMTDIAKTFGKVLGSRGKMPNPKAGCVVPPNANLKVLVERLQKIVRATIKEQLSAKFSVGSEDTPEEQVLDNITTIYTALVKALPEEENNIKNVMIKFSMGPPAVINAKGEVTFKKKEEVAKK